MNARFGKLFLAGSLALAPGLLFAQDHAVPRGGGGGGGSSGAAGRQPSPGGSSGGSSSSNGGNSSSSGSGSQSSSGASGYTLSNAERRHPRAGTGTGGGYYPGHYPGYGPGWGGYYPVYGGYWWPYGFYGGGYLGGCWGYPGYPGAGATYSYVPMEGGSVRVLVDPAEARVYVDGYYAGVVDDFDGLFQRLHVAPGRHDITVKLEGYESHRMRVYVGPDATVKLHYEMRRGSGESFEDLSGGAPPPEREVRREPEDVVSPRAEEPPALTEAHAGRLRLSVEPEDASVYVDGSFRGNGREAATLRLAPGRHRVEVVRPGYRTAEHDVDVAPGETKQLSVRLERPTS
jgi:hypothetical protein